MPKDKELSGSALRERKRRSIEETRREMIGSRYVRCNFTLTAGDVEVLEDKVKEIRNKTGLEIGKSGLLRRLINKLKGQSPEEILSDD